MFALAFPPIVIRKSRLSLNLMTAARMASIFLSINSPFILSDISSGAIPTGVEITGIPQEEASRIGCGPPSVLEVQI